MSENKAVDKANLELALSENNRRILEHTDTSDAALRQDLNAILKYQKYLNTELDYCYCILNGTGNGSIVKDDIIKWKLDSTNNINFDEANNAIELHAGKTYKVSCDIQINFNALSGSVTFIAKNLTTGEELRRAFKSPGEKKNSECMMSFIYTPSNDEKINIQVISAYDAIYTATPSFYGFFIAEEINRQIVIDPVEHLNAEQGLEDAPVGHIISHMGTIAPKHYLICDGAEYNILDYPYLANHILDNFGSYNYFGGDGELTFCVPDLRGEFLRGAGTATRDTGSGGEVGEHQDGTKHKRIATSNNKLFGYQESSKDEFPNNSDKEYLVTGYNTWVSTTKGNTFQLPNYYSSRPTNTSVLYCIKYEPTYYMSVANTNYLSPSLYSKEERVVGCWIDGKPLYEKTIVATTPSISNTGEAIADVSDLNIENCISINGFFVFNNNGNVTNETLCSTTEKIWYRNFSGILAMTTTRTNVLNQPAYITIRYTKTTDAENSFINSMIKDYIVQSNNSESYSDEDINTAISETINTLNEE